MSETTQEFEGGTAFITKKDGTTVPVESSIFNVSTRSIITFFVVLTVCYMSIFQIEIKEPLYTLAGLIVGFYFGQNGKPKTQS